MITVTHDITIPEGGYYKACTICKEIRSDFPEAQAHIRVDEKASFIIIRADADVFALRDAVMYHQRLWS